jgi:cytochrome c oxidase subunit 2
VGLQLPRRAAGTTRRGRRIVLLAVLAATVVLMSGCSSADRGEWKRIAMPEPVTTEGEHTLSLWQGAWIAALVTGVIVWALIVYVVVHYRRRSDDEIPVQTRYNLPLEIFYTIAPVIMVIVFFKATVDTQNLLLDDTEPPDHTIEVVGQQWQWTFNYTGEDVVGDKNIYEVGTANYIPTLVLPVNETTRFNLHSPDVIHDFGVPGFLIKMDVVPGRVNHYQVTPNTIGTYSGKCYELCGVYHSRMLFTVKVVSKDDYEAYLQELEAAGQVSDEPLLGGSEADTQAGLEESAAVSEGAAE